MATEQAPTCNAKATIIIGRHTEADVECGREPHDPKEAHVAKQETITKVERKEPGTPARIIYTWH